MTTEEKIFIAASFDSEKIKMIRELMEEEGKRVIMVSISYGWDLSNEEETDENVNTIYEQTK
jgi:hypothetical protein